MKKLRGSPADLLELRERLNFRLHVAGFEVIKDAPSRLKPGKKIVTRREGLVRKEITLH